MIPRLLAVLVACAAVSTAAAATSYWVEYAVYAPSKGRYAVELQDRLADLGLGAAKVGAARSDGRPLIRVRSAETHNKQLAEMAAAMATIGRSYTKDEARSLLDDEIVELLANAWLGLPPCAPKNTGAEKGK